MREDSVEYFNGYLNKLSNSLYGLLCEKENKGEWEKYLDAIIIELIGLESELNSINYWKLRAKIGSLRYLTYYYFRKTIFECMGLTSSLLIND